MQWKKKAIAAAKAVGESRTMKEILYWPILRDITYRYMALIGEVTKTADGRPLLQSVLHEAIQKYRGAMANDDEEGASHAYIDTLIDSASDCLSNRIVADTDQGEVAWNLLAGDAMAFLEKHQGKVMRTEYRAHQFEQPISRAILMVKILPPYYLDKYRPINTISE